jgi:hypothetical protein
MKVVAVYTLTGRSCGRKLTWSRRWFAGGFACDQAVAMIMVAGDMQILKHVIGKKGSQLIDGEIVV